MLSTSTSIYLLSTVRAFAVGESLWSKAQKDAIYHLSRYIDSADPADWNEYRAAMRVPQGDTMARIALESRPEQLEIARQGLLMGQNHPDDINALIWLLRSFQHFDLVQKPVSYWRLGDQYLEQLDALAQEIQASHELGPARPESIKAWKQEIESIDQGVTPASRAFSESLGRSSRSLVLLLLCLNGLLAAALIGLWCWNTLRLMRQKQQVQWVLQAEQDRAEVTLAALADAVITIDGNGRINYLNPVAMGLLGVDKADILGRPLPQALQFHTLDEGFKSEHLLKLLQKGETTMRDGQTRWLRRGNHDMQPVKVMGSSIVHEGEVTGAVIVLHDVSREQKYMEQLSWNSRHDTLTGLENRGEFERHLQQLLNQGLHQLKACTLLYIDLDQFKLVNETCSHAAGDEILSAVARLLQHNVRGSDELARLGGDEFGVLLINCPPHVAQAIAEKLRLAAQALQVQWGDKVLRTGFSIGMVHITSEARSAADLLRMADVTCYKAKERGRNRIYAYSPEDHAYSRHVSEMEWVTRIHEAIDADRFCLYAQSIAPLQSGHATGMHFEVLLRLRDEQGQLIGPGAFIPAAERYGIMPKLDRWVITRTFQTLARRPAHSCTVDTCAINLSGPSLDDEDLQEFLQTQIRLYGIAPQMLCFEITETSAIANLSNATRLIQSMRALGCRFALDDFGVGMSSLTYLKQLPVDHLKIDGGFVHDMLKDPSSHAMVEMINRIAHILGKQTVAEFVESREIALALRDIGVDYGQGYAIARPVPMDDEFFTVAAKNRLPQWCGAMAMS
ncbi:EAL domain-containing protein [Comamonas sp. w2-DMI]|uniref:EAL domain-containing protein n=1 Tax=Comamonas sp. w2-DMI TaxID=3126391 RepID=UPI0032E4EB8F